MTFSNKYNVYGFTKKDFSYNWLGAKVSFRLLGQTVQGIVIETDGSYYTLEVEFTHQQKTIIVKGHFNCFKKSEERN